MSAYSKLDCGIVHSSVWQEPHDVRVSWITMLALTDYHGQVRASIPALAKLNDVSLQRMEEIIDIFLSPDPYSRTRENEGRRLEEIDGGWQVINYASYRDGLKQPDSTNAERQARFRHKNKRNDSNGSNGVTDRYVTLRNAPVTAHNGYSDSDSDSDSKSEESTTYSCLELPKPEASKRDASPAVMEFQTTGKPGLWALTATKLAEWESLYSEQIDVAYELRKARQWTIDNPKRKKTASGMPKFLGGWLERAVNRGGSAPRQEEPQQAVDPSILEIKARLDAQRNSA